nr:hypothetical protein 1 [Cardiobacteriales bacterium]
MIIFHEGLPRSGKSYEATIMHMLPALKAGRKVFVRINGINYDKFSELTHIPVPVLKQLIHEFTEEETPIFYQQVDKDSLVIIDECVEFWPSEGTNHMRDKSLTRWIKQHGHLGVDIILMDQSFDELHFTWKRRTQTKLVFTKQTAIGRDNNYTWVLHEAIAPGKFKKISSGSRKYEDKYFGLYASHQDGVDNKGAYQDKRKVIWHTPAFKYGVPAFLIALTFAINYLYQFFSGDINIANQESIQAEHSPKQPNLTINHQAANPEPPAPKQSASTAQPIAQPPPQPPKYEPIDYFDEYAHKYRLRLAVFIKGKDKRTGIVDVLDNSFHRKERFRISDIEALGWEVQEHKYGLLIRKGDSKYVARPWPVDPFGRVANQVRHKLDGGVASLRP